MPAWEKKFCSSVGSVPWSKLLEAKRFMHLHNNIIQWNDSAGEKAFSNAKKRFYAEINGLPCDISLPDPDKYIDEVDWNSVIDPKLLSDLERDWSGDVEEEEEDVSERVILRSELLNQSFGCTGWGDTEEAFQKDPNILGPVPELGNFDLNAGEMNSWEQYPPHSNMPSKASGCDNNWYHNDWNCDNWNDCNWNGWDNNWYQPGNERDWGGTWDWNSRHRGEVAGCYMSRYRTSRFNGNDNQAHHRWRNGQRMRRDNFAYQQSSWIGSH